MCDLSSCVLLNHAACSQREKWIPLATMKLKSDVPKIPEDSNRDFAFPNNREEMHVEIGMIPIDESEAERIGPTAISEAEISPGPFERIEQVSDAVDSGAHLGELAAAMPVEMLSRLTLETGVVWSEKFTYDVMQGKKSYIEYLREGLLRDLWDRLRGVQVLRSKEVEGKVAIAEIHCPKIKGCRAHFTQKTSSESDYSLKVEVVGFGGGSGKSFKIGLGYRVPTANECISVFMPFTARVDECSSPRGDFTRRTILKFGRGFELGPIPEDLDRCQIPLDDLRNLKWDIDKYQARLPTPTTKITFDVEMGRQWKHSLGVELGVLSLGSDVSVEVLKSFSYEYELVGPQEYFAFLKPETLGYAWTWD